MHSTAVQCLPAAVTLELDIQVCMLGEGDFEHGRVRGVIEELAGNVAAIQMVPNLLGCVTVRILDQGLEPRTLLKGRDLADEAKGRENQVQGVNGDDDVRLHR